MVDNPNPHQGSNPRFCYEMAVKTIDMVNQCLSEGYVLEGKPSAVMEAAKRLNWSDSTIYYRVRLAERDYGLVPRGVVVPLKDNNNDFNIEMPDFPEDDDIPVREIIDQQKKRFKKRSESFAAHTWFPIKVKEDKAIAIMWFGDPHVDDNGCNWEKLDADVDLCRTTPGLYGANIGDTTNNWAGRLVRLYAQQDTSVNTARRLAEWFMLDSGVKWLVYILGNHDIWGDGSAVLAQMAKRYGTHKLALHDWEARFTLKFPGGWDVLVYTAHNFKGSSIWNPMHGPMREGQIGELADLYVCGDKHTSGLFQFENAARGGQVQTFVRVRGYKFLDDYARHLGIKEQNQGCSAVTVLDPKAKSITTFLDSEEGVRFLNMKREAGAGDGPKMGR